MRRAAAAVWIAGILSILASVMPSVAAPLTASCLARAVPEGSPADDVPFPDSDGDGVPDRRDRCSAPLPGATGADGEGCPTAIDPYAALSFDGTTHRGWYRRFWTGACDGIVDDAGERATCSFVKLFHPEYWHETVGIVTARVPDDARAAVRFDLWRLGRLIGHEWARANAVRAIDSDDIDVWGARLRVAVAPETCRIIQDLFDAAAAKLDRR